MFLKNDLRPAVACAAPSAHQAQHANRREHLMFNGANETDDFNAFGNTSDRPERERRQPRREEPRQPKAPMNKKMLLIGAIAAVAVLLLVVIVIVAALSGSKDITYEDNAYLAYADGDGKYHVAVNGKELEHEFEGIGENGVEVIPAADNSFAYVIDTGAQGKHVYILQGKELEAVTSEASPAINVLAYASLVPGVVVEEEDGIHLYVDGGDERIVKRTADPQNVMISADASTVVYTALPNNSDGTAERRLYIYKDGSAEPMKMCLPVAISGYGDYIYGVGSKDNQSILYVITTKDTEPYLIDNSNGFTAITAMNAKGNEILFTVSNGTQSSTYLHSFKRAGEGESIKLGASILKPANADPTVAVYHSFKETYLYAENDLGEDRGVFFLTKDFAAKRVAPYKGQFDPELKYFYYIGNTASGVGLRQVDLSSDSYPADTVYADVVDFAVSQKGNVYHLDNQGTLRFYKVSEDKNYRPLGYDITGLSFYNYANEIYFAISDMDGVNVVYTSEEGSEKDAAEMDSISITDKVFFSDATSKKTYAYFYDMNENSWKLFYTANGKRFKLISSDCQQINGVEIPTSSIVVG